MACCPVDAALLTLVLMFKERGVADVVCPKVAKQCQWQCVLNVLAVLVVGSASCNQ